MRRHAAQKPLHMSICRRRDSNPHGHSPTVFKTVASAFPPLRLPWAQVGDARRLRYHDEPSSNLARRAKREPRLASPRAARSALPGPRKPAAHKPHSVGSEPTQHQAV